MELTAKTTIDLVWLKEDTDIRECSCCNDQIFSDMYRLWLMPHAGKLRLKGNKTDMCICSSCFNLLDPII